MKTLVMIVALAASVISVPAFARNSATYRHDYQQNYQQNSGSGIPWVDDRAKGPV